MLEVVQFDAEAAEEELRVLREAGVAVRQDEAVAAKPVLVGRVVPHNVLIQQGRNGSEAHRGAGVAAARVLDGVSRQESGGVRSTLVEVGPIDVGHRCPP